MSRSLNNFSNYPQPMIKNGKDDYTQFITKPSDLNITHRNSSGSTYFVIDSRDRDINKYPETNKYRLDIPDEWRDVVSAQLIYGSIPNTYYNITKFNNLFFITEDNIHLTSITIPEGQYNNETLLNTFNGVYGNLFTSLTNKYNFKRNPTNHTLRIQSNRKNNSDFIYNINYTLNDSSNGRLYNSIDSIIGFKNSQYNSTEVDLSDIYITSITDLKSESINGYPLLRLYSPSYSKGFKKILNNEDYLILNGKEIRIYEIKNNNSFTFEIIDETPIDNFTILIGIGLIGNISILNSPNIYYVECSPYVILKIRDFDNYHSNNASDGSYTIIQLAEDKPSTIINHGTIPVDGITKNFNPPLSRLIYLDIEFCNPDGSLFEFRGEDHMLVIRFSMLNQSVKYSV